MKVAAIYRVSTERQVKRDGEDTIPVQRAAIAEFLAQRPGWSLVKEYAEEGVSGFKVSAEDRDVLQQAFQDAKAGLWSALVVFKADRLSRNAFEYPIVIDRFRRIGCEVWSVKDAPGGKLLALDTQMDRFVRFLEGWQAETESKNTSIRVSEAMLQLARAGRWSGGPPPYGFRLNPNRRPKSDTPALVIDPDQARVVNFMVDLYLDERMGSIQIAKELNRRGVLPPNGRPWDDQKVRRILQNPIVAGLPAYNRNRPCGKGFARKNPYDLDQFVLPRDGAGNLRPVPEYQIVPLSRWLKLMNAMKAAGTGARGEAVQHTVTSGVRSSEALLTGLVYCGHCGARLSADMTVSKSRRLDGTEIRTRRIYYLCQTHLHKGRQFCDGQRTYGRRRLESAVTSQLEQLLTMLETEELTELLLGGVERGRQEIGAQFDLLEGEIRKAKRVLEGWLARMDHFLANPDDSPFSEEMLTAKIRAARARSQELEERYQALRHREQTGKVIPDQVAELTRLMPKWWDWFCEAAASDQKLMIRDLLERIIVRRDEVELVFRVDVRAFLPKAREMAAARDPVGSLSQTERLLSPVRSL